MWIDPGDKQTNKPVNCTTSLQYTGVTFSSSDEPVANLDEGHGHRGALHFAAQFVTDVVYVLVRDDKDENIGVEDGHIKITQSNLSQSIQSLSTSGRVMHRSSTAVV